MSNLYNIFPQGYWSVNDKKFINKYQALIYASDNKSTVSFHFHDDAWANFDRSLLGKYSLDELYKKRALQLREKYDYLILYFSGGADSYNILRTFLDNGIKLDEVCVKWCKVTRNANTSVYTPNTSEKSAYNYLSEWDYAIQPVLKDLALSHPEIKIEIVDWSKDINNTDFEKVFNIVNHWHDIEVPSLAVWSPSEQHLVGKGVSVGSIYGVDKPVTYFEDGNAYMAFNDAAVAIGTPNPINIQGTEYFYWSRDFPILPFEMARKSIQWLLSNPQMYKTCAFDKERRDDIAHLSAAYQVQQKLLRPVLYTTWSNRFQALKPTKADRSDKQFWIDTYSEFQTYREGFRNTYNSLYKDVLFRAYHTKRILVLSACNKIDNQII
jgi:hypothetical protein